MTGSARAKMRFGLTVLVGAAIIVGVERLTDNAWLRIALYIVVLAMARLDRLFSQRSA